MNDVDPPVLVWRMKGLRRELISGALSGAGPAPTEGYPIPRRGAFRDMVPN
jgi:hypothetical protein